MSQLHLPAEHTDADLILAGQIAHRIDSAVLYVAWTARSGQAAPAVVAELRDAHPAATNALAVAFAAVRELWAALVGRYALPESGAPAAGTRTGGATRRLPAAGETAG